MKWVRGGNWVVDPKSRALRLVSAPPALSRVEAGNPVPGSEEEWWWVVGHPSKLESYEVTVARADSALAAFSRFPRLAAPGETLVTSLMGRWDESATIVDKAIELTTTYGPLGRLRGVVPPWLGLASEPTAEINLVALALELEGIAEVYDSLHRARGGLDFSRLTRRVLQESARARGEMELLPVFRSGGVVYDARPMSLRAFLWKRLFVLSARSERNVQKLCLYCDQPFDPAEGRGRRADYCPDHRQSRYRQAVLDGRAPSMKSAVEPEPAFNEEDD